MAGFTALAAFSAGQAQANQLFWNGGNGNFIYPVWTDAWGNDGHDFAPGSEVYFQGDGGTIDAIDDPEVGTMEVNGNYSFISADHLTVYGALRVGDGMTGTFDALPTVDDGGIEVNYDATLDLTPIAVNQGLLDTVSHKVADYSAGTVKFQGTAATETLTNHITFRNNVLVEGGLSLNGAESDGYIAIAGEEWDERTFTLTDNLQLEGNAKFLVEGGILDAQGGIVLGSEEGGSAGKLEMTDGKLSTAGITLMGGNENSIEISGGEFTVTGDNANAFSNEGEGDDMTTVSISNATLVAEYNDWTLNHGATLTDVTVVHYDWSKVTIGAEGQETVISGTLTNENDDVELVLLGKITMKEGASLVGNVLNSGSIGFEGATENGGVVKIQGELTLAAGVNAFTSITADSLNLTSAGTTLFVADGLDVEEVVLGDLNNTIVVDRLLNETVVFRAEADVLEEGSYTLLSLGGISGVSLFSLLSEGDDLSSVTMAIGNQTFVQGEEAKIVLGSSGKSLQLVLSADGKSLQAIVTPEPATATLSLLALAGLMARRRRA